MAYVYIIIKRKVAINLGGRDMLELEGRSHRKGWNEKSYINTFLVGTKFKNIWQSIGWYILNTGNRYMSIKVIISGKDVA